jgi:hypothetical protein
VGIFYCDFFLEDEQSVLEVYGRYHYKNSHELNARTLWREKLILASATNLSLQRVAVFEYSRLKNLD